MTPRPPVPGRLTDADIVALQSLGRTVRTAGSAVERGLAIDLVVATCRRYRDADISWTELSHALGISDATLRRWRQRSLITKQQPAKTAPTGRAKPISPIRVAGHPPSLWDTSGRAAVAPAESTQATAGSSISALSDSSRMPSETTGHQTGYQRAADPNRAAVRPPYLPAQNPAVLVLTGDPRRNQNVFDPEAAAIRHALASHLITSVSSEHQAMIELADIALAIDDWRPVVLHLSAHHELAGVALTHHREAHLVTASEIADAIDRADHRPVCAVLSFCRSEVIAGQISRTVPIIVSWPAEVTDEQGCRFAEQFYKHLAARRSVRRAFAEAVAVLESFHPEVASPTLRNRLGPAVLW
ncbi:MAG: hypothetical protein ACRCYU_22880 [Nocardioides sp.]